MVKNSTATQTQNGNANNHQPCFVGQYIRKRREEIGFSQKALGQRLEPKVTTQFVSNVERGVTPLPPVHVPKLAEVLRVSPDEIMQLLEQEYAAKLSGRLGKSGDELNDSNGKKLEVDPHDLDWLKSFYEKYRQAPEDRKNEIRMSLERLFSA